jgi:hypothetical protein
MGLLFGKRRIRELYILDTGAHALPSFLFPYHQQYMIGIKIFLLEK